MTVPSLAFALADGKARTYRRARATFHEVGVAFFAEYQIGNANEKNRLSNR
jgi:hypothetical protein